MHNHWHLALFELASGNCDRAIELYDSVIRPEVSTAPALGTIADGASLLWRCALTERQHSELPREPLAIWANTAFPGPGMVWADAHCMLAWTAVNDSDRLGRLVGELKTRLEGGKIYAGPMLPALGEAYQAFAAGDWERAADQFEQLAPEVIRLGGSHAQRDVFEETRIEAHVRAGRIKTARAMLEGRLDRRHNGRDIRWLERINREYAGAAAR